MPNCLWFLNFCLLRFVTIDNQEKNRQKYFLHRIDCIFFENLCFPQTFRCYKNDPVTATFVRIPCGPLIIVPWSLSQSTMPETLGQNLSITGKIAFFFFENLCFPQPLRCYRNDLVTSTAIVRTPCGPLIIVPWSLSQSTMTDY